MKKALLFCFCFFCFSANFNSSASGVCSSIHLSQNSNNHFSLYIYKGMDFGFGSSTNFILASANIYSFKLKVNEYPLVYKNNPLWNFPGATLTCHDTLRNILEAPMTCHDPSRNLPEAPMTCNDPSRNLPGAPMTCHDTLRNLPGAPITCRFPSLNFTG